MSSDDISDIVARRGIDGFDIRRYVEVTGHEALPAGFAARGNRVFVPAAAQSLPRITESGKYGEASGFVLVLNGRSNYKVNVWGKGGFLFMPRDAQLKHGSIELTDGTIILGERFASSHLKLVARNGGRIVFKREALIAVDVGIFTDDAHTLADATTGERLNPYGGVIEIGEHVWIGRGALIMGDCSIGDHNVIGARALVRHKRTPANVVLAGVPAKIVRTNVTWHHEDIPPDEAPGRLKKS